ncbi:MAG TPA: thiol-disulfide oxidoreductase [Methylococcaceae bacterium]|nr:thiol-disulfide oxidoreductase [Methylococcaceae bacterium]
MITRLSNKLYALLNKQVPATALGLFRFSYGLITLQEIFFLLHFNHLIFDPIPYLDVEFPMIPAFLGIWALIASCVTLGYNYQRAVTWNYLLWIVFVNFTPMQRDFDGGFDTFMIGAGFFLLFMPADKTFSLDSLRHKLNAPFVEGGYPKPTVSVLAYYLPLIICLGFLYFDSAIHKLFAEHWRNGLGTWLPATQPYYVSAIDMSPLLNQKWLQNLLGYTILVFQFTFVFFFWHRHLRVIYLLIGMGLHLGITLSFNIYPFGLGMLCFYWLMVPFSWWRAVRTLFVAKHPTLTVFFDQRCPLCNRTAIVLHHLDILARIDFKNAQQHAANTPALATIDSASLLKDLYAVDQSGQVFCGVDTYIQILKHMGYLRLAGLFLSLPLIKTIAINRYRAIADNRQRLSCDASCLPYRKSSIPSTWYSQYFEQNAQQKPKAITRKLTKILIVIFLLQLNSTIHYGLIYRFKLHNPTLAPLTQASNMLILWSQTFIGIVPHALYLHDHFQGYSRILALTYTDAQGQEQWLPFVNQEGRMIAPNWGRVHSMWANIAVTPHIDNLRLQKFIMKVTAFYGHQLGLDLTKTPFHIQMKKISAPAHWVYEQRKQNMAGEWTIIGEARWQTKQIQIHLPDNINQL